MSAEFPWSKRNEMGWQLVHLIEGKGAEREYWAEPFGGLRLMMNSASDEGDKKKAQALLVRDITGAVEEGAPLDLVQIALANALSFRETLRQAIQEGRVKMQKPDQITVADLRNQLKDKL